MKLGLTANTADPRTSSHPKSRLALPSFAPFLGISLSLSVGISCIFPSLCHCHCFFLKAKNEGFYRQVFRDRYFQVCSGDNGDRLKHRSGVVVSRADGKFYCPDPTRPGEFISGAPAPFIIHTQGERGISSRKI